jgi:RNA polymerase sigma-70 factor (ECF subfamily)
MQEQTEINLRDGGASPDDAFLMQRVAQQDQRAFGQLMQRHLARTIRLATRILGSTGAAEDVAQEAFIRVWKHAAAWESPERAGAKFSTWLYRIVLNLCIDEKRKDKISFMDDMSAIVDEGGNAEDRIRQKEQTARVKEALGKLPERQRAAFVLCFYEGYSNKEAADMLGVGIKAIESLMVRARKSLREDLKEERSGT